MALATTRRLSSWAADGSGTIPTVRKGPLCGPFRLSVAPSHVGDRPWSTLAVMTAVLLDRALSIGADARDTADERFRKRLLVGVALLILPVAFVWGAVYWGFGERAVALTPWAYVAGSMISLAVFARTRNFPFLRTAQFLLILVAPALGTILVGGLQESSTVSCGRCSRRSGRSRSTSRAARGRGSGASSPRSCFRSLSPKSFGRTPPTCPTASSEHSTCSTSSSSRSWRCCCS